MSIASILREVLGAEMGKIPYFDREAEIRTVLLRRAAAGQTIYHGDLGELLGIPARGPWKPVLDEIGREELSAGRPDITYLVINRTTRLPGQIVFQVARQPTPQQRRKAGEVQNAVFKYYQR
jgi:hypothetical protein